MSDPVIGKEVDGYRIQSVLGRGGMGTVYRAEDVNLSRTVALKRINPDQSDRESFIHRFRSEAQALARIDSPHIVGVYALRETDIGLLIVMEYVEGGTLKEPLEREGPMALEQAVPILEQILRAFHDAHSAGVIHRDIKPQNIMLTQDGMVKVTDFGIAKLRQPDSGETVTQGGQGGTLKYMSPEQISNISAVDARSDLYSIGMTAYEMLAGDLPFEASATDFDIMRRIVEGELPPPDELNADIPSGLAQWVVGAIRTGQDDRYQSAEEMLEALRDADRQGEATRTQPDWEVDEGGDADEATRTATALPGGGATQPAVPEAEADEETVDAAGDTQTETAGGADGGEEAPASPSSTAEPTASDEESRDGSAPEGLSWTTVGGGMVAALLLAAAAFWALGRTGGAGPAATLSLTTTPAGATVLVNGDTAGTTPLRGHALEAGAVQLQVEKDGYRSLDSSLTVAAGGKVVLRDVALARAAGNASAPSTADAGEPAPGPTETGNDDPPPRDPTESATTTSSSEPDEAAAEPAPATGSVSIAAEPVGTIRVDGEARSGSTVELPAGEHTVTCRHPRGGTARTSVTVTAGESERLTCYTEVTVNVTTDGPFGRIWLNGADTEKNTNAALSLPPGTHRLEVRRRSIDDFRVEGGQAKVERGGDSRIESFTGQSYEVVVEPTFERVEQAVVFNVSVDGT